jgi:hypothetical protein
VTDADLEGAPGGVAGVARDTTPSSVPVPHRHPRAPTVVPSNQMKASGPSRQKLTSPRKDNSAAQDG